jgi:hypothetical protein
VHVLGLKVLEKLVWVDDGRTHIWLDGAERQDDGVAFDEHVMALVPPSVCAPIAAVVPGRVL